MVSSALLLMTRSPLPTRAPRPRSTRSSPRSRRSADSTTRRSPPTAAARRGPEKLPDAGGLDRLGAIRVADLSSGASRPLSAATDGKPHREMEPVFSPDGRSIAFLSDASTRRQFQVWIAPAAGGPARALTKVKGQLQDLRWSPDGKSVSFLFVEGSTQETGALTAYARDSGVGRGETGHPADRGRGRRDGPRALGFSGGTLRLRLRLVARRQDLRRGGGLRLGHEQLLGRRALPRRRRVREGAFDLETAAPDRLPALLAGRPVDRGHPRHHERRGLQRRRRLGSAGVRRRRARGTSRPACAGRRRVSSGVPPASCSSPDTRTAASASPRSTPATGAARDALAGAEKLGHFARRARRRRGRRSASRSRTRPRCGPGRSARGRRSRTSTRRRRRFWGEAKSLHWQSDGRLGPGLAPVPAELRCRRAATRWSSSPTAGPPARRRPRGPRAGRESLPSQGYFVFLPNPRGSFGFGEAFTAGQRQGLRRRRPARHPLRRRRGARRRSDRRKAPRASSAGATAAT